MITCGENGAPDRIRTCDLCLRRAALYPAELRVHPATPLGGRAADYSIARPVGKQIGRARLFLQLQTWHHGAMTEGGRSGVWAGIVDAIARVMTVPRAIIGALILFSIALNFANVVGRYVFLSPIIWAEEVMIYIMVWCVFIGAILVTWDGRHLRMDLLSANLASPWREIVNFVTTSVFLVVCGFIVVQSYNAVSLFARLGQQSTVADVPMVIPHAALLIGFALMLVGVAVRFRAHVLGTLESEAEEIAGDPAEWADGDD